ncbi:polynucleotide 5'-phosphatase KNAG_0D00910 [Huiozyma naganishii CBS 8797]|uniref:mRNA-capping enzyme subunit beta n=1 Tax=Huiozyma naganishii (strain ATCC MYA-139 / BCRC 22969 / CBS 8797 / KCTC 17520 / NBRC 10181 / NCYC 3082 / Yp74L-3) TaxID=1071383 RepID=J7RK10_HUIN7|nr:hypothetical protein KNAG_0D00910 [Kazachstania naganishii CBS 8797]CCK69843.1 hypothetical protein KNAG_0D00910 [Kazachstania naganishii CBS 8797]
MTKRALSLDDLVNHDDADKTKLQKMSENVEVGGEVEDNSSKPLENNQLAPTKDEVERIPKLEEAQPNLQPLAPKQHPLPVSSSNIQSMLSESPKNGGDDDDMTDTDDEVGDDGGIQFNNDIKFDYEKQDRNPSKKKVTKPKEADKFVSQSKVEPPVVKSETGELKVKSLVEETQESNVQEREPLPKVSAELASKDAGVTNIFEEKATSLSKRNNIKKDLQILDEISSTSKPNKYRNVPIWAQKWKPTVNALQNIDTNDFKIDSSFLNIIPDDDLTKSVQDWVYATIFSIAPDLRKYIELEMKFGIIVDGKSPDRVSPPISSQAIFTELDAHLTPTIDELLFKELKKYIYGITDLKENSGKFGIIESFTKDSVYRVGLATQRPRFLRMSTDVKTGRVGEFIEKRHVSQLLMYSPKDSYDVKISLNIELPVPENDPPEKYQSQIPVSERTKERTSYIHNDSCTRIDVTKVQNHNQGAKGKHTEMTHEIELEINTPALLRSFENITTDSKEYASLIRTFLNNGTIIRRKLSSLSTDLFEGTKK